MFSIEKMENTFEDGTLEHGAPAPVFWWRTALRDREIVDALKTHASKHTRGNKAVTR